MGVLGARRCSRPRRFDQARRDSHRAAEDQHPRQPDPDAVEEHSVRCERYQNQGGSGIIEQIQDGKYETVWPSDVAVSALDLADAGVEALTTFAQLLGRRGADRTGFRAGRGRADAGLRRDGRGELRARRVSDARHVCDARLALLGLGPLLGLPLAVIAMFPIFGIIVYRVFVRRLLAGPPEATVFGTFDSWC